jgi:hypothetical protein
MNVIFQKLQLFFSDSFWCCQYLKKRKEKYSFPDRSPCLFLETRRYFRKVKTVKDVSCFRNPVRVVSVYWKVSKIQVTAKTKVICFSERRLQNQRPQPRKSVLGSTLGESFGFRDNFLWYSKTLSNARVMTNFRAIKTDKKWMNVSNLAAVSQRNCQYTINDNQRQLCTQKFERTFWRTSENLPIDRKQCKRKGILRAACFLSSLNHVSHTTWQASCMNTV